MQSSSLLRQFLRCTMLSVLGTLGVSCYILADTFFIARALGQPGLAALNLAIPVFNLISGVGLMLGMGGATLFSFSAGTGQPEDGSRLFTMTLASGLFCGLLFALPGLFFPVRLASLLGASGDTLPMTAVYLRWLLIFAPAFLANNIFLCFLRNDNAPALSMTAMLAGSFSNILLDILFLFPLQMGMRGAVLATGFSPVISMLCMLPHRLRRRNSFHLRPFAQALPCFPRMLSLGCPALLSQVSGAVVMIVYNLLILAEAGSTGVAAYGVTANIALVTAAIFNGIAQGVQPLFSEALAKDCRGQIRTLLRCGIRLSVLTASGLYLLLAGCAGPIAAAFNAEGDVQMQTLAVQGLRLFFLSNIFIALNFLFCTYFPSVGKPVPGQILACLRGFLLILPAAFLFARFFGMTGIYLSCPAAEALTTLCGAGFLWYDRRKSAL